MPWNVIFFGSILGGTITKLPWLPLACLTFPFGRRSWFLSSVRARSPAVFRRLKSTFKKNINSLYAGLHTLTFNFHIFRSFSISERKDFSLILQTFIFKKWKCILVNNESMTMKVSKMNEKYNNVWMSIRSLVNAYLTMNGNVWKWKSLEPRENLLTGPTSPTGWTRKPFRK